MYKDAWKRKEKKKRMQNWKPSECLPSVEWLNVFQYWQEDMEHMESDQ